MRWALVFILVLLVGCYTEAPAGSEGAEEAPISMETGTETATPTAVATPLATPTPENSSLFSWKRPAPLEDGAWAKADCRQAQWLDRPLVARLSASPLAGAEWISHASPLDAQTAIPFDHELIPGKHVLTMLRRHANETTVFLEDTRFANLTASFFGQNEESLRAAALSFLQEVTTRTDDEISAALARANVTQHGKQLHVDLSTWQFVTPAGLLGTTPSSSYLGQSYWQTDEWLAVAWLTKLEWSQGNGTIGVWADGMTSLSLSGLQPGDDFRTAAESWLAAVGLATTFSQWKEHSFCTAGGFQHNYL